MKRWLYQGSTEDLSFRDQVKALLSEPEFAPRASSSFAESVARCYARFQLLRERLDLRVRQDERAADRPQRVQRGGPASSVGDR